jgi:hypothetical protein
MGIGMRKSSLSKVFRNPPEEECSDDTSLYCGGLFYRAQSLFHLVGFGHLDIARQAMAILAVAWLPLVILTALFHFDQLPGLLKDYIVYSRTAIAVPVLLIGQFMMEDRYRVIVTHVRRAGLLETKDLQNLNGVLGMLRRLRDSPLPELIIVALVFANLAVIWKSKFSIAPGWAVYRSDGALHLTFTGWYYGLISMPLYQFLIGLNLWKWLLWTFLLFKLSRLDLKLYAAHPDAHGGLGFLGLSPIGFAPIAFAISTAIGGTWRHEILYYDVRLANYKISAIFLFAMIFIVALLPLCFFYPKLSQLRRKAILEYGVLGQTRIANFHEQWISNQADHGKAAPPDPHMLMDLTFSYENIRRMWSFPVDKGTLIGLALSGLVPLFPVVLAEIPFSVILKGLLDAVKAVPM